MVIDHHNLRLFQRSGTPFGFEGLLSLSEAAGEVDRKGTRRRTGFKVEKSANEEADKENVFTGAKLRLN